MFRKFTDSDFFNLILQYFRIRGLFLALLVIGIIVFSYHILVIPKIDPVWNFFPNQNDYLIQSTKDVMSADFLSPVPYTNFSPRPFTTSLFYKLADSDPYKMIMLQKLMYIVCTVFFAYIIISVLHFFVLRVLTFYALLFLFTWIDIEGWTNCLLSEATSNSLLFLWLGMLLLFVFRTNWLNTIVFCIVSVLFSFTRDTWPYIILLAVFIVTVHDYITVRRLNKKFGFTFLWCIALFFIQAHTSNIGERHKMPVFNTILGRIAQNDEYLNWFKEKGMPCSDLIKNEFKEVQVDTDIGLLKAYKAYSDTNYIPLMNWCATEGKSTYQLFLITHLDYLLLTDQSSNQINRIFNYKTHKYFIDTSKPTDATQRYFPLFNLLIALVMCGLLFFAVKLLNNKVYYLPLFLIILFTANALLVYNADTLEVNRHLYITQIMIQVVNIIAMAFIINSAALFIKGKVFSS